MPIETAVAALVILLLLAIVSRPLSSLLHLPYASTLVLVGFISSELFVFAGYDTGIRADNYQALIIHVFIPVLVFEAAYNIEKRALRENLPLIIFLAVGGMLFTCLLSAAVLFYGIAHDTGFPWIAALITGAILAATEPSAVFDNLKSLKSAARLKVLLAGESLFNDATVIVLFTLFISIALSGGESPGSVVLLYKFCLLFFGGVLLGAVLGFAAAKFSSRLSYNSIGRMLGLLLAYGSYQIAELVQVSGVMATLMAGIVFSAMSRHADDHVSNQQFWSTLGQISSAIVFIIVGAVITLDMFQQRWLAMLIAILAIVLARASVVYGGLGLYSWLSRSKLGLRQQNILVGAGVRGAVTLALALSLPTSLDYWWTIQSIAFGAVVFTLFVQAPAMIYYVSRPGTAHEAQ